MLSVDFLAQGALARERFCRDALANARGSALLQHLFGLARMPLPLNQGLYPR